MAELLEELVVGPKASSSRHTDGGIPTRALFFAENRNRFHFVEEAREAALVLDAHGKIQVLTPAARQLLDYNPEQSIKPSFFSHVHAQDLYRVLRDVAEMTFYGKREAHWHIRLRTGNGDWQWFLATVDNQLDQPEEALLIHLDTPAT